MSSAPVIVETKRNPGCLLQLLWFAFIGIWLGQAWMLVAWVLMLTVIGLPLGIGMLNMLPKVIALREPTQQVRVVRHEDGRFSMVEVKTPQINIFLRAIYFALIGWWFSALWMELAYLLTASVIGIPIGFWMFDLVPAVLTLRR